jgi:VWFA-related protein
VIHLSGCRGGSIAMQKTSRWTRREVLASAAAMVAGHGILRGQEAPRQQLPTFSAEAEIVHVLASVRDKKGRIVKDLSAEEFALKEDGRLQTVKYFSREADLPLTIGLLVDTTPSESNMLDEERAASMAFLNRMLRPGRDAAFVIQYHSQVELLQGPTSSREALETALDRLQAHDLPSPGGGRGPRPPAAGTSGRGGQGPGGSASGPGGGPNAYETVLADAVCFAADDIMASQAGRKAILILGDGAHVGNRADRAITAAQQADTLIYAIRIYDKSFGEGRGLSISVGGVPVLGGWGRGGPGRGGVGGAPMPGRPGAGGDHARGKENLEHLSEETGGAYYEVGKKQTLDEIYGQIEEELRSQYSLGYVPDEHAGTGFRRITIEVKRKGLTARGRQGYYARLRK